MEIQSVETGRELARCVKRQGTKLREHSQLLNIRMKIRFLIDLYCLANQKYNCVNARIGKSYV